MTVTTQMLVALAAIPVGAMGRRFAGGLLGQWLEIDLTTQASRLIWGLMNAALVFAAGFEWYAALLVALGTWAGSATFGYYNAMLPGYAKGSSLIKDLFFLFVHGAGGVLFIAPIYAYFDPSWRMLWLLLPAFGCLVAYYWSSKMPLQIPFLGCYNNDPIYKTDAPPTAELIWGAMFGIGLVLAV